MDLVGLVVLVLVLVCGGLIGGHVLWHLRKPRQKGKTVLTISGYPAKEE